MNISDGVMVEVLPVEGRRDSKGRVTLDKERRDELLAAFAGSGMSQARFARREGLTYSTFAGWVQKRRKTSDAPASESHRSLKTTQRCAAQKRSTTKSAAAVRVELREIRVPVAGAVAITPAEGGLRVVLPDGIEVRCTDVATVVGLIWALREAR